MSENYPPGSEDCMRSDLSVTSEDGDQPSECRFSPYSGQDMPYMYTIQCLPSGITYRTDRSPQASPVYEPQSLLPV